MVPLMAVLENSGADIVVAAARAVNSTAAVLADDEVPDLGIRSVFPDTWDTRPTMDGLVIFKIRHLIDEIPLSQHNGNANC
jgi:hypothetical protein